MHLPPPPPTKTEKQFSYIPYYWLNSIMNELLLYSLQPLPICRNYKGIYIVKLKQALHSINIHKTHINK